MNMLTVNEQRESFGLPKFAPMWKPLGNGRNDFYSSLDCWSWLNDSEKQKVKEYIEPLRMAAG